MFKLWIIFGFILIVGLIAPVWWNIVSGVMGDFGDVYSQMIIAAGLPIFFVLALFVMLFYDRGGG